MSTTNKNFEFGRLKDKNIIIFCHMKPHKGFDRTLWMSHPEKPIKETSGMRSYFEHNLCINDDSTFNELITGFNQAITENTVKQLNVKKHFTVQRVPFWIVDDGLVLSSIDYFANAHLWTKLSGKLTLNIASRNLLYNHLALTFREPKSFIRQWNKIAEAEKWC